MKPRFLLPVMLTFLFGPPAFSQGTGTLVFYRPKHDSLAKPSVFCDGIQLARMTTESYVKVQAQPGQHICTVDKLSNTKDAATIEVTPGSMTFFRIDVGFGGPHMKPAQPDEAQANIAMLKPVEPKMVFQTSLTANGWARVADTSAVQVSDTPAATTAKVSPANVKVVHDAPLAITFYYPVRTVQARDRLTYWRIYPYIGQKADGSIYFRLRVNLSTGLWQNSWFFEQLKFVADEKDDLPLNIANSRAKQDAYTHDQTSYDFGGPELEAVVRRLASAQGAWLVAYADVNHFRSNVRLKPEHLEAFRVMLAQYDSLLGSKTAEQTNFSKP